MIKINLSPRFKHSFRKVPHQVQSDFKEKISIFIKDPNTPSLKTHKLKGKLKFYSSFYLKNGYRVIFEYLDSNTINLLNIGPHDDYAKWSR